MSRPHDLTCRFNEIDRLSFFCETPSPGLLEWFASVSGIVSTGAAIWFGVWSIRHAKKERLRAEDAERRVRLGQISDKIVDAFSRISETEQVRNADIPWLNTHFPALSQALAPFGETADEFYKEVSKFALQIVAHVKRLFLHEAESETSIPKQIRLGIMQGLIIREAVGTLRSGLNAFAYAENEAMRIEALKRFKESAQRIAPL